MLNIKLETYSPEIKTLELGVGYDILMTIWPTEKVDSSIYQDTLLDGLFYVYDVHDLGPSLYNSYAQQILLKGVFLKKIPPQNISLIPVKTRENNQEQQEEVTAHFSLPEFASQVGEGGKIRQEYHYYFEEVKNPPHLSFQTWVQSQLTLPFFLGLTLFCLLGILGIKFQKNRQKRQWRRFLQQEKNRLHWEKIYEKHKEWMVFCKKGQIPAREFLGHLNSIQYKQFWTQMEEKLLQEYFNEFIKLY